VISLKAKKIVYLFLCLAVIATLFAGCGNNENTTGGDGDKTVVRLGYQGILDKDTIDPISGMTLIGKKGLEDLLEQKLPTIDVEIVTIPGTNWIQKTETLINSGDVDVAWYTNQVQAADWFFDNTELMKNDPDVNLDTIDDIFIPASLEYVRYRSFDKPESTNNYYGFPIDMANYMMVYDKQIFEDWGVEPPSEHASYEEILEKAKQVTGINPKTGKQNYGMFLKSFWLEWHSIGFNATHPITAEDMKLENLNIEKDVEYMKDSPDVLNYFTYLTEAMKIAPAGIASGAGAEKFFTKDNDIAINMDAGAASPLLQYTYAKKTDVTDRFLPIFMPLSNNGMQGFPEFHKVGIAKNAKDKEAAWEVVKMLTTDKEVVNFQITNYSTSGLPAIQDTEGMSVMDLPLNQKRLDYHSDSIFVTDDYWYWRQPLQGALSNLLAGKLTPEQAQAEFYNGSVKWIEDKKKQLGN
jgi:ABC-type glycerol-3-phosphate transport system substrate-binding protein